MENDLTNKYKDLVKNQTYDFGVKTIKGMVRDVITSINQRTPELPEIDYETDPETKKVLENLIDIFSNRIKKIQEKKTTETPSDKPLLTKRKSITNINGDKPLTSSRRKSVLNNNDNDNKLSSSRRKSFTIKDFQWPKK